MVKILRYNMHSGLGLNLNERMSVLLLVSEFPIVKLKNVV